uniref:Uncharacterized protein n=2 Tax=Timema TaxID=61471 RepID=A0A7R9ILC9_9NEOP|nr:unnamed protein product [Timema bartmani]CAD7460489.1 unnamed protein product [Timema tahoe]
MCESKQCGLRGKPAVKIDVTTPVLSYQPSGDQNVKSCLPFDFTPEEFVLKDFETPNEKAVHSRKDPHPNTKRVRLAMNPCSSKKSCLLRAVPLLAMVAGLARYA